MTNALLGGRVALVTGAARGNGEAIARAMAEQGAEVALVDLDGEAAQAVSRDITTKTGQRSLGFRIDVSSLEDLALMIERVIDEFARLDILVNNAGILVQGPFLELTRSDWDRILAVNLTAPMLCSQLAARHMVQAKGGSIINITSMAAQLAPPNLSAYCTSKGGLQMLTRSMAVDLAPFSVRVNAIAPAVIWTDMTRPLYDSQDKIDKITERIPLGRLGMPEDVAGAALYLASDLAAYVTGATITVDGGYMVR